jgi:hypothetical protein
MCVRTPRRLVRQVNKFGQLDASASCARLGGSGDTICKSCHSRVLRYHVHRTPHEPCPTGPVARRERFRDLPVPVQRVSTHAQGLRLRGVKERLASIVALRVAFPLSEQGPYAEVLISELDGRHECAPVNASAALLLPRPAHDSGLEWFATPILCGSVIRDSLPVHPGAFSDPFTHALG